MFSLFSPPQENSNPKTFREKFKFSNIVMLFSLQRLSNSSRNWCFSRPDCSLSFLFKGKDLLEFHAVNNTTPDDSQPKIKSDLFGCSVIENVGKVEILCVSRSMTLLSSLECFGSSLMNGSSRGTMWRTVASLSGTRMR